MSLELMSNDSEKILMSRDGIVLIYQVVCFIKCRRLVIDGVMVKVINKICSGLEIGYN